MRSDAIKLNMNMFVTRLFMIVILGLAPIPFIQAQDAIFSQHFAAPLYLNPAFAGTGAHSRLVFNVRNRLYPNWGALSTINFSYDIDIPTVNSGLGLMVTSEQKGGMLMKNNISAIYAYHLQAGDNLFVNFGAQVGYHRNDLNWNRLDFAESSEPLPDETWNHAADFAAGIMVYSDWVYGGFAAHHLTQPKESFYGDYRLPLKYTAHLGLYFKPTQQRRANTLPFDYFISPNIILQNQGEHYRINYGFYSGVQSIMAGVWYRQDLINPNALIFLVRLTVNDYRIGYSYDYSLSGSPGAHEISVSLNFNDPKRNLRDRIINCPHF